MFSPFILDAMATAMTQAEIHCLLIIISCTFHELGQLWLHVVSASMVVSVLKLIYIQEHNKEHITPEKVKALQGSRAHDSLGEGGEDVENEVTP